MDELLIKDLGHLHDLSLVDDLFLFKCNHKKTFAVVSRTVESSKVIYVGENNKFFLCEAFPAVNREMVWGYLLALVRLL